MKKYFSCKDVFTDVTNINQTDLFTSSPNANIQKKKYCNYIILEWMGKMHYAYIQRMKKYSKSVKLFKQENPDFCKYLEFLSSSITLIDLIK